LETCSLPDTRDGALKLIIFLAYPPPDTSVPVPLAVGSVRKRAR